MTTDDDNTRWTRYSNSGRLLLAAPAPSASPSSASPPRSFTTGPGNGGTSRTGLVQRARSWHDIGDDSDDDSFSSPRDDLEYSSSGDRRTAPRRYQNPNMTTDDDDIRRTRYSNSGRLLHVTAPAPSASPSRSFTTGSGNGGTSKTGLARRARSWHDIYDDIDDDSDDDSFSTPWDDLNYASSNPNNNLQLATTKEQPSAPPLARAVKLGCRYLVHMSIVALALLQLTASLSTWKHKMGRTLDVQERPLAHVSASGDWPTAGAGSVRGALPAHISKSVATNEKVQDRALGVASASSSSSLPSPASPQHRLVGIVLDASAIEGNILNFLVDIACRHNVMSHILSSKGAPEASNTARILMEEKYNSKSEGKAEQCAEIVFATEPPQLIAGIDNRIDRISRLRDYQRDMLMTDGDISLTNGGSSSNDGVVIVADLDLHMLPSVEKVMQEVHSAIHSDGADVVCAAGIMHRPFGYYDTFATVLLPNTFVYPVSGRFDERIHEDEEQQFIVSSDGSFSQEDLHRHFEQTSQEQYGGRPVPVRSCFGGLAIYKSEVWYEPKCRYSSWRDQCSPDAVRYANIEDGRACEHVTFHACLREHRKDLAVSVQPKLMPMWDSPAQRLSSSLRSGEHLLTVHSDTNGGSGSRGGSFNSTGSGHQLNHDHLSSSDARYRMRIHPTTGNVLLEELGATSTGDDRVVWSALDNSSAESSISATNTPFTEWMDMRHAIQSVLVLRDDGRLVLEREVHNRAEQICNSLDKTCRFEVWSSTASAIGDDSGSKKNAFLHLSDQGTLTLQDQDSGELLWSATQDDTWSECPTYIPSGFQLHEGDVLCSPGDTYRSGIDSNGFFVRRNDATKKNDKAYIPLTGLVDIDSGSSSSTMTAHIQGDGNLVVYSLSDDGKDRNIQWSSRTAFPGSEGSRVALHDDGVLRIVTKKGIVLRELIPEGSSPPACPTVLPSGGKLEAGEHLCSHSARPSRPNGPMYKFGLSSSGIPELVVSKVEESLQVVWVASVNVTSSTSTSLILQDDGNLVLYDENSVDLWSSNTAAFGAVVSFSTDGDLQVVTPDGSVVALLSESGSEFERTPTNRVVLESNDVLTPGESICSRSGKFCFGLDAEEDQLCLWNVAGGPTPSNPGKDCSWSKTFQDINDFSASSLIMQGDGNLVLVTDGASDRTLLWSSESHGSANEDSYLVVRDYGAAEIVNKQGITTFSIAGSDVCPRWLLGGQSLRNDEEFICSDDSHYRLGLGSDSNLAIHDLRSQEKVWETGTCCDDVSALLQTDANFIVRGSFDDLWSTDATTNSTSGVALRVSNNGDAEIFDMGGSLVWSSAAAINVNRRTLSTASPLPGCDAVNFRPEDDDFRTFALTKRFTNHHRIVFMSEPFVSIKRNRVLSHRWDFGDAPQIQHKKIKAQDNVPPASLGDDTSATEQCEKDDWQSGSYLTCNSVHESTAFLKTTTFLGQGANNQGWAMSSSTSSPGVTDDFVLKRQVIDNTFSPRYYERARLESLVMQRLGSSSRILDTYGYCGTSIMNQKGWREMSSLGIDQQTISKKQMLQYGLGLSQALADLHESGILHTDLSASNVLIGPEMEVILHDFDQAALLTHGESSSLSCGVRMHDEKCDHYRSPEKCNFKDQVLTTKSDVYGLGGLFYFLLSGATPYSFPEIDDLEVVRSKIRSGTLPQYPLHVELSKSKAIASLRGIAAQCLRYEPENRPEAREVANLIEKVLSDYDEEEDEILALGGSVLYENSTHLQSSNSNHTFGFDHATGDLSIWHNDQIIWSLGLCCQGDDKHAFFTSDGNFVVEDKGGVIYDTGTDYGGQWVGAVMFVDNDGLVKLKNHLGQETIIFGPSESNTGISNFNEWSSEPWSPPTIVDSSTMHGKVFTGYQGWFTTPCDDGLKRWHHWSDRSTPDNETLTIDMWPDLDEYDDDELCETDLSYGDGTKASVFSSYNPKTVDRHIRWMSEYGIDGPFVQRFVTDIRVFRHMRDHVLKLVQASSERYGRVFSNMYDLTGAEKGIRTMEDIKRDWKFLVDGLKITESSRYLNHKGRPVLGLFFGKPSKSPLSAAEALELIDWLQNNEEERYRVTVIVGGMEKSWRSEPDVDWMSVFNKADVISPWTIGRYFDQESVDHHGKRYLIPDVDHCHKNDQDYLPVVFPGFSAKNIMPGKPLNEIPRNGGQFLWRQLLHASRSNANMVFVAMFDEVDEGTAIFKTATTASRAPSNADFVTLDIDEDASHAHETNLPSDFYLQLVGEAKRLLSEGAEFPSSFRSFDSYR